VSSALANRLSRALIEIESKRLTESIEVPRSLNARDAPAASRQEFALDSPGGSKALLPSGEVLWLPRLCAVTREGWVHSYISDGRGRFSPGESIRMPEMRWQQFKRNAVLNVVDVGDMSHEECPWCGATCRGWNGPVLCTACRALVCFGRTTANDCFHCHPGCGKEGQLVPTERKEFGFVPALHGGGHSAR
jgi:hypothetical protein